jgi:hypothetical protein
VPFLAVLDAHTSFAEDEQEDQQLAVSRESLSGSRVMTVSISPARQSASNRCNSGLCTVMPLTPASAYDAGHDDWQASLGAITQSPNPNRFARFDFGVAGSSTRISICPIPLLRWPRTYHSRLQTPSADGRMRPLHGNTQAHPFDISPVGVTLNVVHTMYPLCYKRIAAGLRTTTDRVLALFVPGKCHPPSNSAARETYVALAASFISSE